MASILFVEDDEEQIEYIESVANFFASKGHRTALVTDGKQAMNLIRTECPDVLFTKIMLSGHDGFELISEMKRCYPWKKTGIIVLCVMSAEVGSPLVHLEEYHDVVDSYVIKPYSGDESTDYVSYHEQLVVSIGHLLHRMRLNPSQGSVG